MALSVFSMVAVDDSGNIIPLAEVEVRIEASGSLASLFSDAAGTVAISNPMTADSEGVAEFYVAPERYEVTVTGGGGAKAYIVDLMGGYMSVLASLGQPLVLQGTFAPSGGSFPGGGSAQTGQVWIASDAGTIDSQSIAVGDRITALTDDASTSTYSGNWYLETYSANVTSVAARTGDVVLGKTDVGLANVDNTSDADKPVSTAQQTALDLKADATDVTFDNYFAEAETRPGDILAGFGTSFTGLPDAAAGFGAEAAVMTDGNLGRSLRITSAAQRVVPRNSTRIRSGRMYRLEASVKRLVDPADPAASYVTVGIQYMDQSHAAISRVGVEKLIDLTVASGATHVDAGGVSLDVAGADEVIPAGTIYARPYVEFFGTDHTTITSEIRLREVPNVMELPYDAAFVGRLAPEAVARTSVPVIQTKEQGLNSTIASPTKPLQVQPVYGGEQMEFSGTVELDLSYMMSGTSVLALSANTLTAFAGEGLDFYGEGDNELTLSGNGAVRFTKLRGKIVAEAVVGTPTFATITEPVRDRSILLAGQSPRSRWYAQGGIGGFMAGLRDGNWLSSALEQDIYFIDGATEGSAIDNVTDAVNYWWDSTGDVPGPALTACVAAIDAATNAGQPAPDVVLWAQGEAEVLSVNSGTLSVSDMKTTIGKVFDYLRANCASGCEFLVSTLGAFDETDREAGAAGVRQAYLDVIDNKPWCTLSSGYFDLPRPHGDVHVNRMGQAMWGRREARDFANLEHSQTNNLGPVLNTATLSADGKSVTLSFTTTESLVMPRGDRFDGVSQGPTPFGFGIIPSGKTAAFTPIISATRGRVEGSTIVLEADEDLTGAKVIFPYGYLANLQPGQFVRDDDADAEFPCPGLPLRAFITAALS